MQVLKNRGYLTYVCRGGAHVAIRTTTIEAFVEELVMQRLERTDAADLFATPESDGRATEAERDLAGLTGQLDEWRALAKARKVSPASFAEFEADLLPQIEAAKQRADTARVAPVPEPIRELAGDPRKRWPNLTIYQHREAIGFLIAELKVSPTGRGTRTLDPRRLGESRWARDSLTWAEHWAAEDIPAA
jgi:hypothetical protein